MRGRDLEEPGCIKSADELGAFIQTVGFLPLFRNRIPGFSAEEHVPANWWWTDIEAKDPWCWRMQLSESKDIAYGKFFSGCAGFVSRECFSMFAAARRHGYDFDSLADEGLTRPDENRIMKLFEKRSEWDAHALRQASELNKRFDVTLTRLMMSTYIIIDGFTQKINKKGEPYGWHMSVYTTPEGKWGYEAVTSAYAIDEKECINQIVNRIQLHFGADRGDILDYLQLKQG